MPREGRSKGERGRGRVDILCRPTHVPQMENRSLREKHRKKEKQKVMPKDGSSTSRVEGGVRGGESVLAADTFPHGHIE